MSATTERNLRRFSAHRLLNVFTEVRAGEAVPALLLMTTIFLVLTAYYLVKPAREGWLAISVVAGLSKLEIKAYSSFAQALVLMMLIPCYARLTDRWPRRHLIERSGLFFLSNLVLFWMLQPGLVFEKVLYLGLIFYLWVGIFAVTLVAQFWSVAADLYSEATGKRLFPLIAVGASAGAVVGAKLSEHLLTAWQLESYDLLLIATVPLAAALVLVHRVDRSGVDLRHTGVENRDRPAAGTGKGAYELIRSDRYMRLTAVMVFTMFVVMTNGENILFAAVQEALEAQGVSGDQAVSKATAAFYGGLFFWINLFALLLQAFVVSRLQRFGGFRALVMTPPLVSLAAYGSMLHSGTLGVITAAKTAENSTNYSINNTARHVLWLPVSREMIYKAKAAIDTLCVRLGDGLAALIVLVGTRVLHVDIREFLGFNMILIMAWLILAVVVAREHRRLSLVEAERNT